MKLFFNYANMITSDNTTPNIEEHYTKQKAAWYISSPSVTFHLSWKANNRNMYE